MTPPKTPAPPLRTVVRDAVRTYLDDMGASEASELHERFLAQVEPPLIKEVLKHAKGNQSRAARMLGFTRNTLRSRMKTYDIPPGFGARRKPRKNGA